jgi:hypothetical protein
LLRHHAGGHPRLQATSSDIAAMTLYVVLVRAVRKKKKKTNANGSACKPDSENTCLKSVSCPESTPF